MKYLSLFLCLLLCISCEHSVYVEPPGGCPNPIRLSEEELLFSPEGGISNVVIENVFWYLDVYFDGMAEECERTIGNDGGTTKIECSWFNVTKIDEHTLLVSVDKNEIGSAEREQWISVKAINCFSGFRIRQSSE